MSTGCSNGISTDRNSLANGGSADSELPAADTPAHGHLIISETSGRGTVDAYFSRRSLQSLERELIWSQDDSACYRTAEHTESTEFATISQQHGALLNVGETITVDSRGSTFLSLLVHEIDSVITYAPDALWVSVDFPEDAMLNIPGSEQFPAMQGLNVQRQPPMLGTLPVDGLLAAGESEISWIRDEVYTDSIHIRLIPRRSSQHYVNNESSATDILLCITDDSGIFQLPDEVITALGEPLSLGVSLSRRRSTVYGNYGENSLTVLQISNGLWQPAI
jgi:hypothetical protein